MIIEGWFYFVGFSESLWLEGYFFCVVLEGWREDDLSLTAWFESSVLQLLGNWSCWWPPKAGDFMPWVSVKGYVMGGIFVCLRERRDDFICPSNTFISYGLGLWVEIRAE